VQRASRTSGARFTRKGFSAAGALSSSRQVAAPHVTVLQVRQRSLAAFRFLEHSRPCHSCAQLVPITAKAARRPNYSFKRTAAGRLR